MTGSAPHDGQQAAPAQSLEEKIGYRFQNTALLTEALTHPSTDVHQNHDYKTYERLEFLGDRVLGLVISEMLLHAFPAESEGDLAKRHTALVQARALSGVAEEIGLGEYIALSLGEHRSGGRHKTTVLSDAMEAVIGALYMDGGLDAAAPLIRRFWEARMTACEMPPMDMKTALQEWAQKRSLPLPQYVLLERSGPDHSPVFEMEVRVKDQPPHNGISNSKQNAQKAAAQNMLAYLKKQGLLDD